MGLFAEKCIRLLCEKLSLFPYGQDIVGNIFLLAFWWYSQVQDRSGSFGEMYKNVTHITQNGFTTARRAAMTSWHRPANGSFIRHYCVANSLGWYMHSLSAFYLINWLTACPTVACGVYANWFTRGQHQCGKWLRYALVYEGRHIITVVINLIIQ